MTQTGLFWAKRSKTGLSNLGLPPAEYIFRLGPRLTHGRLTLKGLAPGAYTYGPGQLDNQCDMFHFWSLHEGGAHFLFADGSVHFLRYSAAPILPALASRGGGESVSLPD